MDARQRLVSEWHTVENLIIATSRKRKLQEGEAEELASRVKIKLFADECAVIRNFRGESKLSTYLHVLIDRAALDICTRRTGKFHPSATAKRLGPVAMELERLIWSGSTWEEAIVAVRRNQPDLAVADLNALLEQIPQRKLRDGRSVSIETVEHSLCNDEEADILVVTEERRQISQRVAEIIRNQLATFDDEDRLVLQMHFESGVRLATIARMLDLDPAGLYRRHKELLNSLRRTMEAAGITATEAADLIGHLSTEPDFGLRKNELRPSESAKGAGVRREIRR